MAKRQPLSGALPGLHGDVVHGNVLIEIKTTHEKSFRLTRAMLDKIEQEALVGGYRVGCLLLEWPDGTCHWVINDEYIKELVT